MKPVCIAVVLLSIWVLNCTAFHFSETEMQEPGGGDIQVEEQRTATPEEANPLVLFRTKRQSHLSLCRFCCNCCKNKGCGFCCKF